ncbi:MAG: hypothetical protein KJ623_03930 [Nanoarchaeota archaeon]|nr:hypothetical protein [Nanoarchaeota archaeon]
MKKAVSPLISYIMLIGMVVAMSAIVANYLINQARDINFESQENAVYCAEVAIDAIPACKTPFPGSTQVVLGLNLTNRGYYSISNLSVVKKENNNVRTLDSEEFDIFPYLTDGSINPNEAPIEPSKKGLLKLIVNSSETNEITVTPKININDKTTICNEKLFKLTVIQSDIDELDTCP